MSNDSLFIASRRKNKFQIKGVIFWIFILMIFIWFLGKFFYQSSFGFVGGKFNEFIFQLEGKRLFLGEDLLNQELQKIKEENLRLIQENVIMKEKVKDEQNNLSVAEVLKDLSLEEVSVIGNDNFLDTPSLIVLGGEDKKIQSGMAVLDQGGALIGLIKKSEAKISQIILLNNNESRVGARIAGADWDGVVEGNRNLRAVLTMLPSESQIKKGDEVITDNRNPLIPQGLLLGTVNEMKESEDRLFKEAILDLPYSSKKLTKVWVIVGRKDI